MPTLLRSLILAVVLFLPTLNFAQQGPDTSLTLNVIVTASGDALFRAWDRGASGFSVTPAVRPQRGQFLSAVVLFRGGQPDAAGNCNAEMDITAYDPNGQKYGAMPNAELWRAKPAPSRGATQLSRDYMGVVIEPGDPAGTYRVVVIARDLNARREATAETTFTVK